MIEVVPNSETTAAIQKVVWNNHTDASYNIKWFSLPTNKISNTWCIFLMLYSNMEVSKLHSLRNLLLSGFANTILMITVTKIVSKILFDLVLDIVLRLMSWVSAIDTTIMWCAQPMDISFVCSFFVFFCEHLVILLTEFVTRYWFWKIFGKCSKIWWSLKRQSTICVYSWGCSSPWLSYRITLNTFKNWSHDNWVFNFQFAYVMGGTEKPMFRWFTALCCKAYNVLRKNANLFINLFAMVRIIPDLIWPDWLCLFCFVK
jgi:hypothetical protein